MWIEAIVMPREEPASYRPLCAQNRGALHAAKCAESQNFRATVLDYLQAHELMGAVKWVSDSGSLPEVILHCTPTVLEQLRRAPQFEAGRSLSFQMPT